MKIVPQSTVKLYSDIPIDGGEQLVFSSRANQQSYFASHAFQGGTLTPCQVVRKTGALRLDMAGSLVSQCNYLSFVNPNFDNKEVYARILDYDYVNNECTEITYAIDYWQTWMFDVSFDSSFIEREHLSQADWTKAETNPYDPTIFEFKTNESLITSKDMEKLNYVIGDDNDDGVKLAFDSRSTTHATDRLGVLIKMADINLKAIDDEFIKSKGYDPDTPSGWPPAFYSQLPGYKMVQYLNGIASQDFGFWYLTSKLYDYLKSRYDTGGTGNPFPYTSRQSLGSGWSSANITPFNQTRYEPPVNYIYDAYGAGADAISQNYNKMGDFFDMIVTYTTEDNAVSNTIVDLTIIPNDVITLSGGWRSYITPSQSAAVTSKKLMRFPFCYARVISPSGDVKELQYEKFATMQNGDDEAYVRVTMDLTDQPTVIVAPAGYRINGMSHASLYDCNINEAMYFSQFPTLPYNIDAWTAQVAATANDVLANRTVDAGFDLQQQSLTYNSIGGEVEAYTKPIVKGVSSFQQASGDENVIGAGLAIGETIVNVGMTHDRYEIERSRSQNREKMWDNAIGALGEIDGSIVAKNLELTKAAYAADHYYPSNGVGASNFNQLAFCDIIFMNVSLNSDVLAVYDEYFKHYGYTSGRCGIPRVINYMHGQSSNDAVPHWETIDNNSCTYIKTMDMKVSYSMMPVASYIKAMFDSGVRMIKGD